MFRGCEVIYQLQIGELFLCNRILKVESPVSIVFDYFYVVEHY